MKTYFLCTLGCKVNSYESEALGVELSSRGYGRAKQSVDADIVIVNTCSVTSRADQKSRQHISSIRKGNCHCILIVMGCYSQTHGQKCIDLGADIVVGAAKRSKILSYIDRFEATREKILDVSKSLRHEKYEELGAIAYCENARAYLKIQDGCDNFCSYCYIPTLRGNSRSREPRDVVNEAIHLVDSGYKEIVITGIHIGGYGKDLGDGSFRLPDLLESILDKCPDLFRLRISSIEESEIDDAFLDLLKNHPNIADHLHIPLQSGSAKVLKDMKRHYDTEAFLEKTKRIREVRPDIALTTDVIVGYPTETEEDFQQSYEFCKAVGFSQIHVFPFSSRPGTYASTLKDLAPEIKKERVARLLGLSKELFDAYQKRFEGKQFEVLIEDQDKVSKKWRGHTSNYLTIELDETNLTHGDIVVAPYKIQ